MYVNPKRVPEYLASEEPDTSRKRAKLCGGRTGMYPDAHQTASEEPGQTSNTLMSASAGYPSAVVGLGVVESSVGALVRADLAQERRRLLEEVRNS